MTLSKLGMDTGGMGDSEGTGEGEASGEARQPGRYILCRACVSDLEGRAVSVSPGSLGAVGDGGAWREWSVTGGDLGSQRPGSRKRSVRSESRRSWVLGQGRQLLGKVLVTADLLSQAVMTAGA